MKFTTTIITSDPTKRLEGTWREWQCPQPDGSLKIVLKRDEDGRTKTVYLNRPPLLARIRSAIAFTIARLRGKL